MLDKKGLHMRATFFHLIRSFFYHRDFLEVDTPIRQPVYIPERHITPLASEQEFLQTSPELCMKRLLAAGNRNIFQICRCFRKAEKGRLHLEEFQMLEWYRVGADYRQLMLDCEALVRFLLKNLMAVYRADNTSEQPFFSGCNVNNGWERMTVGDAFTRYSPISLAQAMDEGRFDEILVASVEPNLGTAAPVFLCDYPIELASLAKKRADNPAVAERFELYINGVELANGFSELTDTDEQRSRFMAEIAAIQASTGRKVTMPEKFLTDLAKLDTAAGIALGLDRLFMIALNRDRIDEAVTFAPEDF